MVEKNRTHAGTWWCRLGSGYILVRLYINNSAMAEKTSVQNVCAGGLGAKVRYFVVFKFFGCMIEQDINKK